MNDQNTATANRLKTLTQTKNTRATITGSIAERQQHPEQRQVGDEEVVDDRDEAGARQPRHQRAVERLGGQQRHEGRGEQPRQVPRPRRRCPSGRAAAAARSSRRAGEEIGERPQARAHSCGVAGTPAQPAPHAFTARATASACISSAVTALAVPRTRRAGTPRIGELADRHRIEAGIGTSPAATLTAAGSSPAIGIASPARAGSPRARRSCSTIVLNARTSRAPGRIAAVDADALSLDLVGDAPSREAPLAGSITTLPLSAAPSSCRSPAARHRAPR